MNPALRQTTAPLIEQAPDNQAALLPLLHAIQDELGFVPPEVVPDIAQRLHLSRAEVHGVITFYHQFRTTPPARHVLRVCRAEACQSMGADALVAQAKAALGCEFHGQSADGAVSLEPVYCLGHCACAPAVMVDDVPHARMSPAKLNQLIASLRRNA